MTVLMSEESKILCVCVRVRVALLIEVAVLGDARRTALNNCKVQNFSIMVLFYYNLY